MSALPIAANLNSAMYAPLVILLVGYVVLAILANRARGHEDRASADRFAGYGFGLVLLSAVWTVVLLLSAVVSYPSRFYDMADHRGRDARVLRAAGRHLLRAHRVDPAQAQARREPLTSARR